ncbi:DUF3310 domain-containing protein [Candidatus Binatia bacterium]|nr:DUF3310 domain-containing protein [Candidatus Binatia bacterium]
MSKEEQKTIYAHSYPFDTVTKTEVGKTVKIATDTEQNEVDMVNHPPHYTQHPSGIECIQITEHMNFNLGSVVKYVWRCDDKHEVPIEDLKKAEFYIRREIDRRLKKAGSQ